MIDNLYEIKPEPNEEVLRILDVIRDRAERGEVQGIGIVFYGADGSTSNVFYPGDCPVKLVGEIEVLKTDLIHIAIDTRLHSAGDPY